MTNFKSLCNFSERVWLKYPFHVNLEQLHLENPDERIGKKILNLTFMSHKIVLGIGPHVKEDQLKNSEVLSLGNAVDDAPFYGKWDIHV